MSASGDTDRIEMDPEALDRAASDLEDAGRRLTASATTAGGVSVSAQAFGSMNAYLGAPVAVAAQTTTDLLRAAGGVVSALGVAAAATAEDWRQHEAGTARYFSEAVVDLRGAQGIL